MLCIHCGQPLQDTDRFCIMCGQAVKLPDEPEVESSVVLPEEDCNPIPASVDEPQKAPLSVSAALRIGESPRPLTRSQYFVMEMIALIPVVNIICLCIWAFGADAHPGRVRLAQAKLLCILMITLVFLVIALVSVVLIITGMVDWIYVGKWPK